MASGKVIDLRNLLAERFPHAPAPAPTCFITGLSCLDRTLGAGLPKSAITELISPQISAGSASIIHALLQSGSGVTVPCLPGPIALIDGWDSFDPQSYGNFSLRHLLWVRCTKASEAVKAADLLLRDGNFPLVIVDIVLNPANDLRKIPQTNWYRLQRLVESTSTACLVLTRQSLVSSAQLKIVLENRWALESVEKEDAVSRLRFRIQRSHLGRDIVLPRKLSRGGTARRPCLATAS
jgi:hypothetical protein